MAYVDYDYYTSVYKGSVVPQSSFAATAERASEILDALTYGRIASISVTEDIKKACCAICDSAYRYESRGDPDIQSEHVGSYSVTYHETGAGGYASFSKAAARMYLAGTGLLYRGFYDNEC